MKYTFILIVAILSSFQLVAQSKSNTNKALNLLNAYWAEQDESTLEDIDKLVQKIFEDESAYDDSQAHFAKAQLMTAKIMQEEFEPGDVNAFLEEFNTSFEMALKKDSKKAYRYFILEKLYGAKAQLGQLGADQYVEANYEDALQYYNSATYLNELEIDFPRMVRPDTSTIYTTAVVAQLAKDNDRAIELFQKLVDMDYNRRDIYDYLIRLYERENFDVKARKVEILRNKRFPEEK